MADQCSQLIEAVRIRSVLYDSNHKDYLRSKAKQRIWEEVAKETNFRNGNEAKDKWEKLRHSLRDALRRQKKNGGGETKLWKYQRQMEFLQPFSSSWEGSPGVDLVETTPSLYFHSSSLADNSDESNNNHCDREDEFMSGEAPNSYHMGTRGLGGTDSDPLYYFFMAMYETAKRMPPKNQINVRNGLFHLIVNEEESMKEQD